MRPRPPRVVQEQMINQWMTQVAEDLNSTTVSEALMELSACHLLGFGTNRNLEESLKLLRKACVMGNSVAKAILGRVSQAMNATGKTSDDAYHDTSQPSYFSNRVVAKSSSVVMSPDIWVAPQLSTRPHHQETAARVDSILLLMKTSSMSSRHTSCDISLARLEELWDEINVVRLEKVTDEPHSFTQDSLSQVDISAALTEACKTRQFESAKALTHMCVQYVGPHGQPTPLHWLIKFPPDQAQYLMELMVCGPANDQDYTTRSKLRIQFQRKLDRSVLASRGICHHLVNVQSACGVYLPDHCMELFGGPLHWAVRCNNLELVRELLKAGADPIMRCISRCQLPGEPARSIPINYNALDVALEYHLFDIASEILAHTRDCGKHIEIGASLLARTTTTWSRFVIHGSLYHLALTRTIRVLMHAGWNLEHSDYFHEIPLLVALQNCAEERYIIEELISISRRTSELSIPNGMNLATLLVISSDIDDPSGAWKFEKLLPTIEDLNTLDKSGKNALHYCAILGNARVAEIMLSSNRLDLNRRSASISGKKGSTPLMLAAQFGRTDIAELLLKAGADANLLNDDSQPGSLELAVYGRQFSTASLLIRNGASIDFRIHNGSFPANTVLHAACINATGRPPLTKRLLDAHPQLQSLSVVNRFAGNETSATTPLHHAVHYADLESVQALLDYGADPDHYAAVDVHDGYRSQPTVTRFKNSPRDLVSRILRRAADRGLDKDQLRVALHGQSESMRNIPFLSETDRIKERAQWEYSFTVAKFDFRLEDVQAENQGQAGVREFVNRLEEIKRLMDEHVEKRKSSTL
jgi:ankyrin repeat protein